jgi:hypothetical protein
MIPGRRLKEEAMGKSMIAAAIAGADALADLDLVGGAAACAGIHPGSASRVAGERPPKAKESTP